MASDVEREPEVGRGDSQSSMRNFHELTIQATDLNFWPTPPNTAR